MNTDSLRSLWKVVFGDTDAFLDHFFSIAYSPERCSYYEQDGEAICALYWFDCAYEGGKLAYIYAVATHPEHRGKGICRRLMEGAHEAIRGQGIATKLYEHTLAFAREQGCQAVTLNVWYGNDALKFYEKCGMKPQKIGMEYILC